MAAKLTQRAIKAVEPPRRGSRLIWDAELTGFALRLYAPTKLHPKGARTFVLSYWRNGTERRFCIGSWPDWSVTAARAKARELRQRIERGEEVASDRREQSQHGDGGIAVVDVSDPALPVLPIPSWVPASVARFVRDKYARYVHEHADLARDALAEEGRDYLVYVMELLLPVVCDPRMRGVWQELYRRRGDGTFLHPARDAWWERRMLFLQPAGVPSAADARDRQDGAVVELFDAAALACQQLHRATTTRREAEQQRNYFLARAQGLERDTIAIEHIGCCYWLWRAAQAYKDYAHETYTAAIRTAGDRNHDGRARWVALTIANKFHELFGSPMYTLTATITSVVLRRTVTPRRIRQWAPCGL